MRMLVFIRKIRLFMLIIGGLCLTYGIYQKFWYSDLIRKAVKTIEANQFDEQYLEKAKKTFLTSKDLNSYNMGVRAYRAKNPKQASEYFYEVVHNSRSAFRKMCAYYNLGNILVQLELPKKAAEMYKQSLRLDPTDWESKYNLERLYVFYPMAFPDDNQQASLDQEPGDDKGDKSQMGKHGAEKPDI